MMSVGARKGFRKQGFEKTRKKLKDQINHKLVIISYGLNGI